MKIERMLSGMQTADGKIISKFSDGALKLLHPKSRMKIQSLTIANNRKVLWFPTEQVIAYPIICEVTDKEPTHGNRKWVQTQTFLFPVLEFADFYLNNGANIIEPYILPELEKFPEFFEPINV